MAFLSSIYIGIGANLSTGDHKNPKEGCLAALKTLAQAASISVKQISPWYRSAPVPISEQPWFYNAVVEIECALPPHELLEHIHRCEASAGRLRKIRNEARVLDIDIIDYKGIVINEGVILPHPRMDLRAFVLYPLRDIAPDWQHPRSGRGIDDLIADLDDQQIERED